MKQGRAKAAFMVQFTRRAERALFAFYLTHTTTLSTMDVLEWTGVLRRCALRLFSGGLAGESRKISMVLTGNVREVGNSR